MKILIVEDSSTLRLSMKKLIIEIGHTPLFANSGEEALQMMGATCFDLVIMDVEMPGLDGFETTSLMREILDGRWIPIIYATGNTSDDSVLRGIEAGGDDYLIKPISRVLLEAKIKAMQRIAQMQQQLRLLNTELVGLSQFDGLTDLLNRKTFVEKATQSLSETQRNAQASALMMLDVDFFKQYNDTYGHVSGDECLQRVASVLKQVAHRVSDIVGRYGGEEFIVMLPQTNQEGAMMVAEKIIASVEALKIEHSGSSVSDYVTISIGLDMALPTAQNVLEDLVLSADKNLYSAKEQGRNRVVSCNEGNRTILIASDDEAVFDALTCVLQPLGNIITTDNQHECMELVSDIMPDVILLDRDSHGINSKAIANLLRENSRTQFIPVIVMASLVLTSSSDSSIKIDSAAIEMIRERVAGIL